LAVATSMTVLGICESPILTMASDFSATVGAGVVQFANSIVAMFVAALKERIAQGGVAGVVPWAKAMVAKRARERRKAFFLTARSLSA
jgi:hypothetical protein